MNLDGAVIDSSVIGGTTAAAGTFTTLTANSNTTIGGTLGVTGVVTANAGVVVDNITIDGTEIDLSSGDLTIDAAGRIDLSADDNGEIRFFDGSLMYGQFKEDSSNLVLQSLVSDKDLIFRGNDDGTEITALTLDMSDAGSAYFNNKVGIGIASPTEKFTVVNSSSGIVGRFTNNTNQTLDLGVISGSGSAGGVYYNNANSGYHAFQVGGTEAMRIDSNGKVGIGSTSITDELELKGDTYRLGINSADHLIATLGAWGNSGADIDEGHLAMYSSGTETIRIATNADSFFNGGNVGIGTSSPVYGLDVRNTIYTAVAATTKNLTLGDTTNGKTSAISTNNDNLLFYHDGSNEGMRITEDGKVYINRSSHYITAADQLAVTGRIAATSDGSSSGAFNRGQDTGTIISFLYSGSGKGSITTDGSNVAYNTSSDARLKNVLGDAKGLDIVNQLNPVNFEWKETGDIQDGLIAQEVEPLIPEAVSLNEETDFYEMDYSKLVTPLIKAVQEQQEQIEELKQQINELRGN